MKNSINLQNIVLKLKDIVLSGTKYNQNIYVHNALMKNEIYEVFNAKELSSRPRPTTSLDDVIMCKKLF